MFASTVTLPASAPPLMAQDLIVNVAARVGLTTDSAKFTNAGWDKVNYAATPLIAIVTVALVYLMLRGGARAAPA